MKQRFFFIVMSISCAEVAQEVCGTALQAPGTGVHAPRDSGYIGRFEGNHGGCRP